MDDENMDAKAVDAAAAQLLKEQIIKEVSAHWYKHFQWHDVDISSYEAELKWIARADQIYSFPSYAELVGPPNPSATRQEYITEYGRFIGPSPSRLAILGLLGFFKWRGGLIFGEWSLVQRAKSGKLAATHFWHELADKNYAPNDRLGLVYGGDFGHMSRPFMSRYDTIIKDATRLYSTLPSYTKQRITEKCSIRAAIDAIGMFNDTTHYAPINVLSELICGHSKVINPAECAAVAGRYHPLANSQIESKRPSGRLSNRFARVTYIDGNPANCHPNNLKWTTGRRTTCTYCLKPTDKESSEVVNKNGKRERICHECLNWEARKRK